MGNQLNANHQLNVNDQLFSINGFFRLIMQTDGNLVLYRTDNNKPLWASNTISKPATKAVMQSDGNFVAYNNANQAVWASNTNNNVGAYVILQNDGNLVVYNSVNKPLWASNTVQTFSFSIDSFEIINTRSRGSDTDYVGISITVGNGDPYRVFQPVSATKSMGDLNNGSNPVTYPVNLALNGVNLLDTDVVVFSYHITNSSDPSAVNTYLESTLEYLTNAAFKAGLSYIGLGAIAGLADTLLNKVWGLVFTSCDGPVAVAAHTFTGAQLRSKLANHNSISTVDPQPGVDSNAGCGSNSNYNVNWSVRIG